MSIRRRLLAATVVVWMAGLSSTWAVAFVYNGNLPSPNIAGTNWDAITYVPVGIPGTDPMDVANFAYQTFAVLMNGNRSVASVGPSYASNSQITINQTNVGGIGVGDTLTLNSSANGSANTLSQPAMYQGNVWMKLNVPVVINANVTFYTSGSNSNIGGIELYRDLSDGVNSYSINKTGYGTFYYQNLNAPTFDGGLTINQGAVRWRPQNPSASPTYAIFGTGAMTLLNGGTFDLDLQSSSAGGTHTYAFPTLAGANVIVGAGGGGIGTEGNDSGRNLNFNNLNVDLGGLLVVGSVTSAQPGTITYKGTLRVNHASASQPGILTLQSGSAAPVLDATTNIVDGTAGPFNTPLVLKAFDRASFTLTAANSYTSDTIVDSVSGLGSGGTAIVTVGAASNLGTGNVEVRGGGRLVLNAATNIASGKAVTVDSNGAQQGYLGLKYSGLPTIGAGSSGIFGIDTAAFAQHINMATLGNGQMYLGSNAGGTYTNATLEVGAGNVYRLGGGGNTLILNQANVLANNAGANSLVIGSTKYMGAGTVNFTAANNITGSITVNAGSKLQGVAQLSGGPFGSGTLTLNGATLQLDNNVNNYSSTNGMLTFSGQSTVQANGTTNKITTINVGGLTRSAQGVLVLSGNSLGSGGANDGRIVVSSGAPTPVATNNSTASMVSPYYIRDTNDFVTYDATYGFKPVTYSATANLNLVNNANAEVFTTSLAQTTANANAVLNPTTVYALKAGHAIDGAALTISSGGLLITSTITNPINFGGEAVVYAYGTSALNGALTSSSGLTKAGASQLTLGANNSATLSGQITINGGTLNVTNDNQLGATSNAINLNGGTLRFSGGSSTFARTTISTGAVGGTLAFNVNGGGNPTIASTITLDGPLNINPGTNSSPTITGTIQDASGKHGLLLLTGSAQISVNTPAAQMTYSGGTLLRDGSPVSEGSNFANRVIVAATSRLGAGDVIVDNALLILNGDGNISSSARLYTSATSAASITTTYGVIYFRSAAPSIGSLEGLGNVVLGNSTGAVNTVLTVGGDGTDSAFYGTISQVAGRTTGLTKTGIGTFTLGGLNSYTGTTTLNNGKLLVNGSLAGGVTATGGILGGAGVIAGPVSVTNATLSPGNSPGILSTGNLALGNGSTLLAELAGATAGTLYDQVNVTGTVSLASSQLSSTLSYAPLLGDTLTLIKNDGTDPVTGIFTGLPEGTTFDLLSSLDSRTYRFMISYAFNADSGSAANDVTLTNVPVPEPATLGLLCAGIALFVRRPLRRRVR